MMKKYLLSAAILISGLVAHAQQTVYVFRGATIQAIPITNVGDITFSADGTQVIVGQNGTFNTDEVDSITFDMPTPAETEILVVYSGNTASVAMGSGVQGVTQSINGADVTLTSNNYTDEYTYKVMGTTDNGSLLIVGDYKLTLELSGCSIASASGEPINVDCGKRIAIKLVDGTVNTFVDCAGGQQKGCFVVDGHAEFEGGGTLNVTGNTNHGMKIGEYLQVKKTTGAINILKAVNDGIHCGKGRVNNANNYFEMKGGVITVKNVGGDCVDADDYGVMRIEGGALDLEVAYDAKGLKSDSTFTMTGGTVNFTCTKDLGEGIRTNYHGFFEGGTITGVITGNGTKGINANKSGSTGTVLNGGYLYMNGTDVTLTVSGGTHVDGADKTKCHGLRAEQILTQTAGTIDITVTNTDAKAYNAMFLNRTGGTLNVK